MSKMSSRAANSGPSRAAARLLHDYQEVMASRDIVGMIDASPLDDNLFEWHVNLWLPSSGRFAVVRIGICIEHAHLLRSLDLLACVYLLRPAFAFLLEQDDADCPIHLVLTFTEEYPSKPPSVLLCTPFPHANVVRKANGSYAICLDMLEPRKNKSPYSGWSSAMSVLSILVQLQSFLTTKKLHYSGAMEFQGSMDHALRKMANFECRKCSHHGSADAWPVRRQQGADCLPPPTRLVCRPCGTVELTKPALQPMPWSANLPPPPVVAQPSVQFSGCSATPKVRGNLFAVLCLEEDEQDDTDACKEMLVAVACETAAPAAEEGVSDTLSDTLTVEAPHAATAGGLQEAGWVTTTTGPSKRTQKKNDYRRRKRERERGDAPSAEPTDSADSDGAAGAAAKPAAEPATSMAEQVACAVLVDDVDEGVCAAEQAAAECAGPFALLSYDALLILMERLHSEADVRALACTCSHLRDSCDDGLLWRVLFNRHFPASQLSAASLGDWRHAYMLELSNNAEQLRCFHSKVALGAFDVRRGGQHIFGIPITFTVNPRTHEVDYIYSTLDTLSFSAFKDDSVRTSVWGEAFTHFLPLYLTRDHFCAARPILHKTIASLCAGGPKWRFARGRFVPEMVLDVLPKLLCTLVVLLVDKGVAASDVFIDGFVQVYRLLLALAEDYPALRVQVTQRVHSFIGTERQRVKAAEPSLGVLVPLLALCNGLRWCDLAWPLLEEMMDRAVIWACRDHPEMAKPHALGRDELVQLSWESRRVSNRLLMFSVGFLARLAKLTPAQLDDFHGNPTPWLRRSMQLHIAKVMAVDSWPEFFALINVPLPSKAYMQSWISRAVSNSAKKGYHKKGMDFSRVQRSGVSAILRKGESVSASPTMKTIRLEEVWRYPGEATIFLDASALTYSFEGMPLAHVDYSSTRSATGVVSGGVHVAYGEGAARVALRHSGDQIVHDKREGTHTIDIDLSVLSDRVGAIYLTLSAWGSAKLKDIIRPEVRCFDPADKSAEPLARYELDGRPTGTYTAVVMAKVWRSAPGRSWKVTAIGELGGGRAGNYAPMHKIIHQCEKGQDSGSDSNK